MFATRIEQKGSAFYFIAYRAEDLLARVRFSSRFYGEQGETLAADATPDDTDEVARFIAGVEKKDESFQREMKRTKVKQIINFYETAESQPPIPGTILLFTKENLRFTPLGRGIESAGELTEPHEKFLIIDGQHRLAALHFYCKRHPHEAVGLRVPCVIFDGRSEDFAVEMFVTINSTATRINKSHMVDLYERVSWTTHEQRFAAHVAERLYSQPDSPLRYRINRLGGRSKQVKWILQAELFNELHRWTRDDEWDVTARNAADRAYDLVRDYLQAARAAWGDAWGNERYEVTKPVTLKAMLRVCNDLAIDDRVEGLGAGDRLARWTARLRPWSDLVRDFRSEGFYERFPAKGQLERVSRVERKLADTIGLESASRPAKKATVGR
ncbi:MAG: DGQHR domain-containing protein [Acidobacteria bacterium]|nr:MAG: DGQHR domain-containing protein [Acidobacteriota bacterium]